MCLLLTKVASFLELVQTASGKCFYLLRWRKHSRFLSAISTDQSIGSRCIAWDVVSLLFRFLFSPLGMDEFDAGVVVFRRPLLGNSLLVDT